MTATIAQSDGLGCLSLPNGRSILIPGSDFGFTDGITIATGGNRSTSMDFDIRTARGLKFNLKYDASAQIISAVSVFFIDAAGNVYQNTATGFGNITGVVNSVGATTGALHTSTMLREIYGTYMWNIPGVAIGAATMTPALNVQPFGGWSKIRINVNVGGAGTMTIRAAEVMIW